MCLILFFVLFYSVSAQQEYVYYGDFYYDYEMSDPTINNEFSNSDVNDEDEPSESVEDGFSTDSDFESVDDESEDRGSVIEVSIETAPTSATSISTTVATTTTLESVGKLIMLDLSVFFN